MKVFLDSPYILMVAVVLAALVCVVQLKQYAGFNKCIRDRLQKTGEELHSTEYTTLARISMLIPVAICAVVAIVVLLKPSMVSDPRSYLVFCLILSLIFGTSFFTSNMTQKLFYTDSGFFLKDRYVPFGELARLAHTNKGERVILKDGSEFQVTLRQMRGLEELRDQKAFKLNGKKK